MSFYRTDREMNDGRIIRYYDDQQIQRDALDKREKSEPAQPGEIRLDPLVNEWVAVAAHRQSRAFLPPKNACPLCPTSSENITEIPESDFQVVVFDNKSPSFSKASNDFQLDDFNNPALTHKSAIGKCEVICFTPKHEGSFGELSLTQIELVAYAWRDREQELSQIPYIAHITPFENRGEEIGVTLNHPHGQIYAYPFVPPKAEKEFAVAKTYFEKTGKVLLDDILAREFADGQRIIEENADWVAFVPYAARYPFEIHILPKKRVANLAVLSDQQIKSFAPIAKNTLQKLDGVYGLAMPYIAAWHQAPVGAGAEFMGAHWQITCIRRAPNKLKYLAGSESAMGAFIMDISPEEAAKTLKEVKI